MPITNNMDGIRSGIWKGQIGSTFYLKRDGKQVTGLFQTVHGTPDFAEMFEVTGFTDGEFIGFVVLWEGHHSVTSWTGRHCEDEHGEHIRSLWHIGFKYKDEDNTQPTEDWNCILNNFSQLYYHAPLPDDFDAQFEAYKAAQ